MSPLIPSILGSAVLVLCGDQAGASNGNELWAMRVRLPSETP